MNVPALARSCLFAGIVLLAGCQTAPRQDNTAILIARPDFATAAQAAPAFVSECLLVITRLESELQVTSAK